MATNTYSEPGANPQSGSSTQQKAKEKASDVTHQAQDKATQLAGQAKEQAKTQLAGQKDRATEQLGSISTALHETERSLHDQNQDGIARYVGDAAHQVERLSDYLRNHTVGEMFSEAERYARREPALFIGGAALLGLIGARFFKSSSPNRRYDRGGYERRSYYGPRATRGYRERTYEDDFEASPGRSASRTGAPGYDQVHGTTGAEMPDPDRSASPQATPARTQSSTLGTEPQSEAREGRRNA